MVMLLCCRLPAIIKYGTKAYQQLKALGIKQIKFTKSVLDFLILKLNPLVTISINGAILSIQKYTFHYSKTLLLLLQLILIMWTK